MLITGDEITKIISVSLTNENITSLENIKKNYSFNGKSESIRHAIKTAEAEIKELSEMNGPVEGVLIMVHKDYEDAWVNQVQHRYKNHIKTHLHSHLKDYKCLEVMIISSESNTVKDMLREIHSFEKADYIKFVRS
ncbi:MAG: CopG family transcriptional regulator [archaeon]|nr:CopG family transcriptional regulator [archaeon]